MIASPVAVLYDSTGTEITESNPLPVGDDFNNLPEALADQAGAGAVLTFTFSNAVILIMVDSMSGTTLIPGGAVSRAIPGGVQTPSATLGVRVVDEKVYIPTSPTTSLKVFAPAGATVSAFGWRR